jgi:hypothetical protein
MVRQMNHFMYSGPAEKVILDLKWDCYEEFT